MAKQAQRWHNRVESREPTVARCTPTAIEMLLRRDDLTLRSTGLRPAAFAGQRSVRRTLRAEEFMSFYSSRYRLFLFLGNPHLEMLWNYSGWSSIEQHFSGLLVSTRGPARVRSNQIDLSSKKTVSFGRMSWDSKSHDKWLHGSPTNSGISDSWLFSSFEAWMPSWIECEKEDKSPDVFLHIVNEESTRAFLQTPMFNPTVLVAISEELFRPELVTHIREIQRKTESRLFTIDNRPWGISSGAGFSDSIQDLLVIGIFRPGPVHDGKPIEEKLRPEWKEC